MPRSPRARATRWSRASTRSNSRDPAARRCVSLRCSSTRSGAGYSAVRMGPSPRRRRAVVARRHADGPARNVTGMFREHRGHRRANSRRNRASMTRGRCAGSRRRRAPRRGRSARPRRAREPRMPRPTMPPSTPETRLPQHLAALLERGIHDLERAHAAPPRCPRGSASRVNATSTLSTFGTGQNTCRDTVPASRHGPYQAAFTLGAP